MRDKITYSFPNFNDATVEAWKWACLLIHAGITVIRVSRTDLWSYFVPIFLILYIWKLPLCKRMCLSEIPPWSRIMSGPHMTRLLSDKYWQIPYGKRPIALLSLIIVPKLFIHITQLSSCKWWLRLSALLQLHLHSRLTPGFNGLGKNNCKTKRETLKFGDLVRLMLY